MPTTKSKSKSKSKSTAATSKGTATSSAAPAPASSAPATSNLPRARARPTSSKEIAKGFGPYGFRVVLAFVALLYLVALWRPGWVPQPARFFLDATALFPHRDSVAQEYRLLGYSCERKRWEWMDPRPYFPLRGDDKESRFQRLIHFYHRNRTVMWALDDFIYARHDGSDDGIDGPIGGIEVVDVTRPIPEVGTEIERYHYDPLAPVPENLRRLDYKTVNGCSDKDVADKKCEKQRTLKSRCHMTAAAPESPTIQQLTAPRDTDGSETGP